MKKKNDLHNLPFIYSLPSLIIHSFIQVAVGPNLLMELVYFLSFILFVRINATQTRVFRITFVFATSSYFPSGLFMDAVHI